MIIKVTTLLAAAAVAFSMSACGGVDQEAAPQVVATAQPLQASVMSKVASAAPSMLGPIPAAIETAMQPAAQAPQAAAADSADAPRVIAWEQSYSLEMNRRHAEQLAQQDSAPASALEQGAVN